MRAVRCHDSWLLIGWNDITEKRRANQGDGLGLSRARCSHLTQGPPVHAEQNVMETGGYNQSEGGKEGVVVLWG